MAKPIVIALLSGADPYWTLTATCLREPMTFLGPRAAPESFLSGILGAENPTQVVVFDSVQKRMADSWFYDPVQGKRRKIYLIGEANAQPRRDDPPGLTVAQIRKLNSDPRGWCVTSTDNPVPKGHDGCVDAEDAITWMKNTGSREAMLVLVHRAEDDRIDKAYAVYGKTWIEVPLTVRHPKPGQDTHLYSGCHNSAADRLPEAIPLSFRLLTIRPTGIRSEYAVAGDDGSRTTRSDKEAACVYAHSLGDQHGTVVLLEYGRRDKITAAFLCLKGAWAKLSPSVVRFLDPEPTRAETAESKG